MLDMEASSLEQIADLVLDNMINKSVLPVESREKVRQIVKNFTRNLNWPKYLQLRMIQRDN